jgi:hypothetical protein
LDTALALTGGGVAFIGFGIMALREGRNERKLRLAEDQKRPAHPISETRPLLLGPALIVIGGILLLIGLVKLLIVALKA